MFDIVHKQQFYRLGVRACGVVLQIHTVVRSAAVQVAVKGNQFDSAVGGGALQLGRQFLVGFLDRGLEYILKLGAGVPRACGVQGTCNNNNPYQYA